MQRHHGLHVSDIIEHEKRQISIITDKLAATKCCKVFLLFVVFRSLQCTSQAASGFLPVGREGREGGSERAVHNQHTYALLDPLSLFSVYTHVAHPSAAFGSQYCSV